MTEDELMTTHEVASLLKVDPQTVFRMRQAGRIPFLRLPGSRQVRYRRSEILAMLGDNRQVSDITESQQ